MKYRVMNKKEWDNLNLTDYGVPPFLGKKIKPTFPILVVSATKEGNVSKQHTNITTMLFEETGGKLDWLTPTYNIGYSGKVRYHMYNIVGDLRRTQMAKEITEFKSVTETIAKHQGKDQPPTPPETPTPAAPVEAAEGEGITKVEVKCHKCGHTQHSNPNLRRIRCTKCRADITKLVKGDKPPAEVITQPPTAPETPIPPEQPPTPLPVNPAAPEPPQIQVTAPNTPHLPPPTPTAPPVSVPPTTATQPPTVPPVAGSPQVPPVPGTLPPVAPPPTEEYEEPLMFTTGDLSTMIHPLHLIEKKMINDKAGKEIVGDEIILAMDKSLAVMLYKIEEKYPDSGIVMALMGYAMCQASIIGALYMIEQDKKKEIAKNTPPKGKGKGKGKGTK